ncbi:unnamed protein product [Triticum turgidum subsp. durum]|uniref:Phosphatidylinositol N-acetylglucosaminyltransferase subunit Y n=1 Tax=Triticum turgidum subsp. durum TaxID=4567 RepID=A0A9R1S9P1_TRITD|nr:unnamed protein product [Triticum turgidum subsp. durum]
MKRRPAASVFAGSEVQSVPKKAKKMIHFSRDELTGSAFVAFGIILFVGFFYAAVVSKMLPPYENRLLSAIQNDRFYCLLVPLTLPMIIVAVYLHWLSMKMFKHA